MWENAAPLPENEPPRPPARCAGSEEELVLWAQILLCLAAIGLVLAAGALNWPVYPELRRAFTAAMQPEQSLLLGEERNLLKFTEQTAGELADSARSMWEDFTLPATPESTHLLDRAFFGRMRPGSYLVNTARGAVIDDAALCEAIRRVRAIHIADPVYDYIARLTEATRSHPMVRLGISPRGALALCRCAKAAAFAAGRDFVLPEDAAELVPYVFGHRLMLSSRAKLNDYTPEAILARRGEVERELGALNARVERVEGRPHFVWDFACDGTLKIPDEQGRPERKQDGQGSASESTL